MNRSAWSGIVGAGELAAVDRCSGSVWRLCNWVISFETWETRAWIARLETAPCSSWWSMRELLRDKKSLNSDALAGSILVRSFCHGTESSRSNCEWKTDSLYWQLQNTVEVRWAGSAGAVTRQCRVSSSGREHSPVRTLQGNTEHDQARNSLRTWKTDTESKETTRVKTTIWQRITETPARYRQCRRATPVTILIARQVLGNADKHNKRVHPHGRTQNEHTDPWTVTETAFKFFISSINIIIIHTYYISDSVCVCVCLMCVRVSVCVCVCV